LGGLYNKVLSSLRSPRLFLFILSRSSKLGVQQPATSDQLTASCQLSTVTALRAVILSWGGIKEHKPESYAFPVFPFSFFHAQASLAFRMKRKSPALRTGLVVFVAGAGFEPTTFGL